MKKAKDNSQKKRQRLHIILSVFIVVVGSVGGGLASMLVYDYLYKIGKVNFYTMAGVLVLAMGVMLPEIMVKLSKQ